MNAETFMDLMNTLPDEMLVSAYKKRLSLRTVEESASAPFSGSEQNVTEKRAEAPVNHPSSWLTAAALAACLLFAVGFGAILLHKNQDNLTMLSSRDDLLEVITTSAETQTVTTAQPESETRRGIVTQTTAVSGTAQTTESHSASAEIRETALQNTTTAMKPAAQSVTETEPLPTIAGRPYDPEIVAKYQLGDINMDGRIDTNDRTLLMEEYNAVVQNGGESILTPEQLYLADFVKSTPLHPSYFSDEDFYAQYRNYEPEPNDYVISSAEIFVMQEYWTQYIANNPEEFPDSILTPFTAFLPQYEQGIPDPLTPTEQDTSMQIEGLCTLPVKVGDWTLCGICSRNPTYPSAIAVYECGSHFATLKLNHMSAEETEAERTKHYDTVYYPPDSDIAVHVRYSRPTTDRSKWYATLIWNEDDWHHELKYYGYGSSDEAYAVATQFIGIQEWD